MSSHIACPTRGAAAARRSTGRTAVRLAWSLAAAGAGVVGLPAAASAHVTVQPEEAEGGGFTVVALRVPNERDDASTTSVRVVLPEDRPIGSVQTTAVPGWKVATATRRLSQPLDLEGATVRRVVSAVTWTATSGGVRPGQFQDFALSLGPLPRSGDLVLPTIQTYSDGEEVRWNEVSQDPSTEPEHPAPTLHVTGGGSDDSATVGTGTAGPTAAASSTAAPAAAADDDSAPVLPTVLSGAALLVAIGAVALAWQRGRG